MHAPAPAGVGLTASDTDRGSLSDANQPWVARALEDQPDTSGLAWHQPGVSGSFHRFLAWNLTS